MSDSERIEMIGSRYKNRREAGEPGWAADQSYQRKADAFDRLVEAYGIPVGARILKLGCGGGEYYDLRG